MSGFANTFLFVFAALFPLVNPLGGAPLFLGLTSDCTAKQRGSLALRVAVNSFWLLLGSMVFGSLILEFFGITVPVVRVAGGALVAAMGWKLLNEGARPQGRRASRGGWERDGGLRFLSIDTAAHRRARLNFCCVDDR